MSVLPNEMESFLPSEIARLVYGYLEEECSQAAQAFLETSTHLKECLAVAKKGRKFSSKIYGLSLIDLFDLLTEVISFLKENSKSLKESFNINNRLLSLINSDQGMPEKCMEQSEENSKGKDEIKEEKNQQPKNVMPSKNLNHRSGPFQKSYDSENKEGSMFLIPNQSYRTPEQDDISTHFIKIKEEYEVEECGFEIEDNHDEEEIMPGIEPEVEILSPDVQFKQESQPPTVNVITNPIMVGRTPSQLVCQPYGMVHIMPAFPLPGNTTHPTLYMSQQGISTARHPVSVHQPQTIIQTAGTTSSNISTVWPKPKVSPTAKQPAPVVKTYKRPSNCTDNQTGNKEKNAKLKQNIYQSSSKLRPIAPKITHSLENGVKVQIVHTKENPMIDTNQGITKRCLRSRRKSNQKTEGATPLFIDIQDVYYDN